MLCRNIYLGQTFACYISLSNHSGFTLNRVAVNVSLPYCLQIYGYFCIVTGVKNDILVHKNTL